MKDACSSELTATQRRFVDFDGLSDEREIALRITLNCQSKIEPRRHPNSDFGPEGRRVEIALLDGQELLGELEDLTVRGGTVQPQMKREVHLRRVEEEVGFLRHRSRGGERPRKKDCEQGSGHPDPGRRCSG